MKFNTILNNLYLCKNTNKSKLFLHSNEFQNIIHFVEYQGKICIKRIEFKKRANNDSKYLYFSIFLTNDAAFAGDLKISSNSITGSFSIVKLKDQTHIIEGFYTNINQDAYTLEHIQTTHKAKNIIDKEEVELNLSNIDNFLQYILSKINDYYIDKSQKPYSNNISFSQILAFEQIILSDLKNSHSPDINTFIENYEANNLKRIKTKE